MKSHVLTRARLAAGTAVLAVGVVAGCALPSTTAASGQSSPATSAATVASPAASTTAPPPPSATSTRPVATTRVPAPPTTTVAAPEVTTEPPAVAEPSAPTTIAHAASLCGAPANPYGYNFCGGGYVNSPPSDICSYFSCIDNFWNGKGYMVECSDGMYSMSGGRRGACSYHGGEQRPVDS
jgi:hypothetical protein